MQTDNKWHERGCWGMPGPRGHARHLHILLSGISHKTYKPFGALDCVRPSYTSMLGRAHCGDVTDTAALVTLSVPSFSMLAPSMRSFTFTMLIPPVLMFAWLHAKLCSQFTCALGIS